MRKTFQLSIYFYQPDDRFIYYQNKIYKSAQYQDKTSGHSNYNSIVSYNIIILGRRGGG